MAGSSVNPFIGIGQICISLRRQLLGRMEADGRSGEEATPACRWDGGSALKAQLSHPRATLAKLT